MGVMTARDLSESESLSVLDCSFPIGKYVLVIRGRVGTDGDPSTAVADRPRDSRVPLPEELLLAELPDRFRFCGCGGSKSGELAASFEEAESATVSDRSGIDIAFAGESADSTLNGFSVWHAH